MRMRLRPAADPGALGFDVDLSSTVYDGKVGSAIDSH